MRKYIPYGVGQLMALAAVPQLLFSKAVDGATFYIALIGLILMVLFPAPDLFSHSLGLNPANQPAVSGVSYNEQFLSTLQVLDNFHKPTKYAELVRRFGDQGLTDFDKIILLGGSEMVSNTSWSVRLEDFIVSKLVISAAVIAGNTATLTVDPSVIDAQGNYYAAVGDVIQLPNENVAKITSKVNNTLTAKLFQNLGAPGWGAIGAGTELGIGFNIFGEDTDQPDPKAALLSEEAYESHILKTTARASNSELVRTPWVTRMSDGTEIPLSFSKAVFDAEYRIKQAAGGATFFSQAITNPDADFAGHRSMTGLIPWIRGGGIVDLLNVFSLNKLYAMSKALNRYYAPNEYRLICAGDAYRTVEQTLTNLFTQNPIVFTMNGSMPVSDLKLGFKSAFLDDRLWHLDRMHLVNHPEIYDLQGYQLQNLVIVQPNNKTKDKKNGGSIPYMSYFFTAKDGYSRKIRMWYTGGGGPMANNDTIDRQQLNIVAEVGTRPVASNHWGLFE